MRILNLSLRVNDRLKPMCFLVYIFKHAFSIHICVHLLSQREAPLHPVGSSKPVIVVKKMYSPSSKILLPPYCGHPIMLVLYSSAQGLFL